MNGLCRRKPRLCSQLELPEDGLYYPGRTDLIPKKIPPVRRLGPRLSARGEKTTTISLRASREPLFQPSLASKFQRSSMLSANKYPGSAADSTRRRSENLPARTLSPTSSLASPAFSAPRTSFSPLLLPPPLPA